jgi:multiple sugar transport system substrate-binding protein
MLTRRHLLNALATVPLATVGCRLGKGGQITVRFWNGFTGPDGRTMLQMVRKFNAANPDVNILMQRIAWGTMYNKLFVSGLGGRAPEVFVIHSRSLLRFAKARFVAPLEPIMGDFPTNDIDPNVWAATSLEGQHYGLPLDVHAMGMYYNKKLFRAAGLDPAKPPTTKEDFVNAIKAINKKGKNGEPDTWGYVFTNFATCTYSFLKQFGGQVFNEDYTKCTLARPENIAALQFCRDLIKDGLVPSPENIDSWIGFRQGHVGMVFEGIYMLADLQKQTDLEFGGAPIPQVSTTNAVWADSHNLCLKSGLAPEVEQAAWRFMKFLSNNSIDWAAGGQIPTRPSLRAKQAFKDLTVPAAFAEQIPYVQYIPRLPFIFEYETEYGLAVEKILRGKASPEEALTLAEKNVNAILAREAQM